MRKNDYPAARTKDIVVQELGDETLVYDLKINKAVCLNKTSAMVWQHCNGKNDVFAISSILSVQMKSLVSEELVEFALYQLHNEKLLENQLEFNGRFRTQSRREVIKKIGLSSAVALPLIGSIVAPTAGQAQSGCLGANELIVNTTAISEAAFDVICQPLGGQCCSGASTTENCMPFFSNVLCDCRCA